MKYKKIIQDNQINKKLRQTNIAKVAKKVGVSKSYLYMAMKDDFAVTEKLYNNISKVVDGE